MNRKFSLHSDDTSSGSGGNEGVQVDTAASHVETVSVAVVGDAGVGKGSLVARLIQHWWRRFGRVPDHHEIGSGCCKPDKTRLDLAFEIVVPDPINQHQLASRLASHDVFLLVYSSLNDVSFQSACEIREQIIDVKGPKAFIIFVANKLDVACRINAMEKTNINFKVCSEMKHEHIEVSAELDRGTAEVLERVSSVSKKKKSSPKRRRSPPLPKRVKELKRFFRKKKN